MRTILEAVVDLVDDDAGVVSSLSSMLRAAGWRVRAFSSADEYLKAEHGYNGPRCLILDYQLPGMSGLELQEQLANLGCDIPIVFLTGRGDIPTTVRAVKAGAIEFLTKPPHGPQLIACVSQALARDEVAEIKRVEARELRGRYSALTEREREVMSLVVQGLMNKQIAERIHTAEITVKLHRGRMMKKMGVRTVPDLVRAAQTLEVSVASQKAV